MASRTLLLALIIAALAVSCSAYADRKLMQGMFNCGGAKQLDRKCCQMCWCLGDNSNKKSLAADAVQKYCREQCQKCVERQRSAARMVTSCQRPVPRVYSSALLSAASWTSAWGCISLTPMC